MCPFSVCFEQSETYPTPNMNTIVNHVYGGKKEQSRVFVSADLDVIITTTHRRIYTNQQQKYTSEM